jgi:hypothetical protein
MKPALPGAVHHLASFGDSAMKGLSRNKKWDVVTFDMEVNTVRSRSNLEGTGVQSGTMDGHGLHNKPKLVFSALLCARGLQGREN